jgi:hypothetical protein
MSLLGLLVMPLGVHQAADRGGVAGVVGNGEPTTGGVLAVVLSGAVTGAAWQFHRRDLADRLTHPPLPAR